MWNTICGWLSNNALAIFLSAVASFVASKIYFDKANRESVLMTIIFPIIKILDSRFYNQANYEALYKINASYATKYLKRDERNKLLALLTSYRNVCRYTKESADTNSIMAYYTLKLEENGINSKPCTMTDGEGNFVDLDFPPNYNLLENHVFEIVSSFDFVQSPGACSKKIAEAFNRYTKKYYTDKEIAFFEDCTITEIIESSEIAKKWEEKFRMANKCKQEFLNLAICKKVTKIIRDSSVNEFDRKVTECSSESKGWGERVLAEIKKLKDTTYSSIYVVLCFVEQTVILEALKDLTSLITNETVRNVVYFGVGLLSLGLSLVLIHILIKRSKSRIENDAKKHMENGEISKCKKTDNVIECATMLGYLSPALCLCTMFSGFEGLLILKWAIVGLVHLLGIAMPLLIRKK